MKFLPSITDAALGRLEDKATQVRKYAIQLLRALIERNPFGFELKLSEHTKLYENAVAQLKEKTERLTQRAKEISASQKNNSQASKESGSTADTENAEEGLDTTPKQSDDEEMDAAPEDDPPLEFSDEGSEEEEDDERVCTSKFALRCF